METSLVEKLSRSRNLILKLITFGWATSYGSTIVKSLVTDMTVLLPVMLLGLAGSVFFVIGMAKLMVLIRQINSNSTLREALNDELHRSNVQKSFRWGFTITIVVVALLTVVSSFTDIKALLACQIVLFSGVLSFFIAALIYNKE